MLALAQPIHTSVASDYPLRPAPSLISSSRPSRPASRKQASFAALTSSASTSHNPSALPVSASTRSFTRDAAPSPKRTVSQSILSTPGRPQPNEQPVAGSSRQTAEASSPPPPLVQGPAFVPRVRNSLFAGYRRAQSTPPSRLLKQLPRLTSLFHPSSLGNRRWGVMGD